jgi:hypothetical protein
MNDDLLILGRTNWREDYRQRLFGLREGDRFQHVYVIGQTGTGKTTLMANLMWQDLKLGRGLAFLDPHGDAVERLVEQIPPDRRAGVIYLDVPNPDCPFGFNPLEAVPLEQRAFAASGIIEAFRNVWGTTWGPRLEHILRNALLTLLDQPSATLADIPRLFTDEKFLKTCLPQITHPTNLDFWTNEFAKYPYRYRIEALAPVQNKLGAFLAQPPLFRILTRPKSGYNLRQVLDGRGVLLVNLAKGRIGGDGAALLGSLIVSRLGLTGVSRQDVPEATRVPFFVYLDEFHTFTTTALAGMLSELRKYRLGLVLAHQYVAQLEQEVRDAIFGNAGTLVAFRVGPDDARALVKQFTPEITEYDLVNLPDHDVYVRLLVDGEPRRPFSATTLEPLWEPNATDGYRR